ncbi:ABC transporter substrate-binding protein [Pseudonocardia sp. H11422]|uniref:ABC transporter substrate-binding protein n=1 Tax=Pseudonocardia sp. H11422 TaxID=2835866 RepID=UPI001BDD40C6|nr:ABC transporter substrate-binding protein [Pseudonocardia sp. H11422]
MVAATGGLASACGSGGSGGDRIKIGYVSPVSGPLSPFAETDEFIINSVRDHFANNPIPVGGRTYPVEILHRDSQSDPGRAADLAADLILNERVHMILVSSTPETSNPVSDQCEANGVPCVATITPWQPWFQGRGGQPDRPFNWTYLFFWGLEDIEAVYADMWDQLDTNKVAGALWPADSDGLSWGDPATGFPPAVAARGYRMVDPGNFPTGTQDFTRHIAELQRADAQILVGVPTPEDFATFWRQAAAQNYRPRIVTIAKALPFPSAVEAIGRPLAENLGSDVWWSPNHPFSSSLTRQSSKQLGDAYTAATGRQWTMPMAFIHALFEVAAKAFASVSEIDDRQGLSRAIATMRIDSIVGTLDWTRGPVPNVAKTPLVGGQWRAGARFPFELQIVSNAQHPDIPTAGRLTAL